MEVKNGKNIQNQLSWEGARRQKRVQRNPKTIFNSIFTNNKKITSNWGTQAGQHPRYLELDVLKPVLPKKPLNSRFTTKSRLEGVQPKCLVRKTGAEENSSPFPEMLDIFHKVKGFGEETIFFSKRISLSRMAAPAVLRVSSSS
jgi:hypothetical protein